MKRSRIRILETTTLLLVGAAILILVVFPLLSPQLDEANLLPKGWHNSLKYISQAQTTLMQVFVIAWFTFLGSCFASFLNVVAWRVPRGRTINGSSHCPKCNVRLSMLDNIPIYGWLRNHGQCRNCREPISPRYLIVELILGAITLAIVSVEIFGFGWNLPGFPNKPFRILENIMLDPQPSLFWFAAFHLTLIYLLFTFAVIRNERLKIPLSIFSVGCGIGLGFQIAWPELTAIDFIGNMTTGANAMPRGSINQIATIVIGIAAGASAGFVISKYSLFSSAGFVSADEIDLVQHSSPEAKETSVPASRFLDAVDNEEEASENREDESNGDENPDLGESVSPKLALDHHEEPIAFENLDSRCEQESQLGGSPSQPYRPVASISEPVAAFALVGMFLGWPGVVSCLLWITLLAAIQKGIGRKDGLLETISAKLFVAAIGSILTYRVIAQVTDNLFG